MDYHLPWYPGGSMLDSHLTKKSKVSLSDYDFRKDIDNRLLMSQFTATDFNVLEEILYSSINIPIKKLAKTLDLEEEALLPILKKLSPSGLFSFDDHSITVDKEMRKYFEMQILKFDPHFKPGLEFLQSLLRRVPIHILPTWYSISRTSNNIFDSIIEKHLLTPNIFQRHLIEISFPSPVLSSIVQDVYQAPDCTLFAQEIIDKYHLSKEQFEEYLLYLEFYFVCCLSYRRVDDHWLEVVTPFYEWHEYLRFLKQTETPPLPEPKEVERIRPEDFSFTDDLATLLEQARKQPLPLKDAQTLTPETETLLLQKLSIADRSKIPYLYRLIDKLRRLKLADVVDQRLYALEAANDYLDMRPENRALFLYRHPLNHLEPSPTLPAPTATDRNIKEAEKSIQRVLHTGWVYFDEFIQGVTAPLSENSLIILKRQGKNWKYTLPAYSEEEITLLKTVIFDALFEMGMTAVGSHRGRDCFMVTPFGQSLFGR